MKVLKSIRTAVGPVPARIAAAITRERVRRAIAWKSVRKPLLLAVIVAVALFTWSIGAQVKAHKSPQVVSYNRAMNEYRQGLANGDTSLMDNAIKEFDQSIADYKSQSQGDFGQRIAYGTPSTELAALAQLHKGILLLAEGEMEQNASLVSDAFQAIEESIKLNPGGPYTGVSEADAQRMNEEALVAKYDLELLLKKHPDAGKGQGQSKPGNGPPAQPAPGQNPGNMPGHGNPNQL